VLKAMLEPKKEEEPNIGDNCIPVIRRFIFWTLHRLSRELWNLERGGGRGMRQELEVQKFIQYYIQKPQLISLLGIRDHRWHDNIKIKFK
jgi:hypothetical protein